MHSFEINWAGKKRMPRAPLLFINIVFACVALVVPASARDIIDMIGRRVALPDKVERIFSTAPPTTLVVYALKPESLIGWNFAPSPQALESSFLDVRTKNLPILGNMMGHGPQANMEEILALKPDLAVAWTNTFLETGPLEKRFAEANVPLVFLKLNDLSDYPKAFKILGQILNDAPRATQLSAYVSEALVRVEQAIASVPRDQQVKVYYAESPDGLATDCDGSLHAEAIRRAGGENVYHCAQGELVGLEKLSLEQIVQFAPDIIISQDRNFTKQVSTDRRWRNVKAADLGKVVSVPNLPFNWIDRPPSYMQALGTQWLANLFYPQAFPLDLMSETKHFYKLFLNVDLSDQDVDRILN
jgi:iron complex transport system substrate-binding protein